MTGIPADAEGLLRLLRGRGVRLAARGRSLDFDAPAGALTDQLIEAMRRFKPELLILLAEESEGVVRSAPASVGQARQFHLTVNSDAPETFTVALRFTLRGQLDHAALQRALTDLVARHPTLRTRYTVRDGEVIQQVLAPGPVELPVVDVPAHRLEHMVQVWTALPFPLDEEPSFRALLARVYGPGVDPDLRELIIAMHHGVVDGWSTEILVRDLGALYRSAVTGEPDGLPTLTADFIDFSRWERDFLADERTRRMVKAWADQVAGYAEPVRLPTDRPRSAEVSAAGATVTASVPAELVDVVGGYAVHRNVTPFVVYAAAFAGLVHELTGAAGVALTVPVANRTDPRFTEVVGVFTHSPWLVVEVAGVRSFNDLVDRTAAATWQLLAMQSVPIPVLSEALGEPFTGSPPRVFLAMLDLADPVLRLPGVDPAPARDVPMPGARADQTWYLRPLAEGGLSLVAEYATALFDPGTVHRWIDRWQQLLRHALADPGVWPPPAPATGSAPPNG